MIILFGSETVTNYCFISLTCRFAGVLIIKGRAKGGPGRKVFPEMALAPCPGRTGSHFLKVRELASGPARSWPQNGKLPFRSRVTYTLWEI